MKTNKFFDLIRNKMSMGRKVSDNLIDKAVKKQLSERYYMDKIAEQGQKEAEQNTIKSLVKNSLLHYDMLITNPIIMFRGKD